MSKKNKNKNKVAPDRPLPERIAKARQEGRTQQALELARQLYKQQRIPANEELVRQTTLERGQHLQASGMLKDAATLFTNALTLGGSPEYRARVASHLAACGATSEVLAMSAEIGDPVARQRLVGQAVDAALAKGPAGKSQLPADLHAGFDLILSAFAHSEAGRDEEARTALQGIGLQSPFMEWKLFLRGLLAYYVKDDARALENWQRLDAQRLPARLAAPFRFGFDPAFRQAQPVASHAQFSKQLDRMQGPTGVTGSLQALKADLPQDNLAPAFRKAEAAVAMLRHERPELIPRLAHCFEWAILDHGQPEDLDRYLRVFGRPADDPNLHRLQARALEERGMMQESHKAWQNFMKEVAASPKIWPPEIGKP